MSIRTQRCSWMIGAALMLVSVAASAELRTLAAPRTMQRGSTCWAATATVVMGYYNQYPDDRADYGGDTQYLGLCETLSIVHWDAYNCASKTPAEQKEYPCRSCCEYWYGEGGQAIHCTRTGDARTPLNLVGLGTTTDSGTMTINEIIDEVVNDRKPIILSVSNGGHFMAIVGVNDVANQDQVVVHNGWAPSSSKGGYWVTDVQGIVDWDWNKSYLLKAAPPTTHQIYMPSTWPAGKTNPVTEVFHDDDYVFQTWGANETMDVGPYVIPSGVSVGFEVQNGGKIQFNPGFEVKAGADFEAVVH